MSNDLKEIATAIADYGPGIIIDAPLVALFIFGAATMVAAGFGIITRIGMKAASTPRA